MANGHSAEGIEATVGRDFEFSEDLRGPDVDPMHDPRYPRIPQNTNWQQQQTNQQRQEEEEWQKADQPAVDAINLQELQMKKLSGEEALDKMVKAFKRPFPLREVLTRPGKGSILIHYIDSRSVQKRLDDVVGIDNWQTKMHETRSGTRVLCELSVRINGEWITKTDGSGDTDFEKEKGAISRALCRAATHFGIGRYLYNPAAFDRNNTPATWATPEGYDKMVAARADPTMYSHIE